MCPRFKALLENPKCGKLDTMPHDEEKAQDLLMKKLMIERGLLEEEEISDDEVELLSLLSADQGTESLDQYIRRVTPRYPPPEHVQVIMDLFEASRHESIRATVSLPPRHAKTETAMSGLAWRLHYDPACLNAFCSYSARFAGTKSRNIQRRFVEGGGELDPNNKAVDSWGTMRGGGLVAPGVGGLITGLGITGVGIIDDPIKNREEADSALVRNKLWEWYTSTFHTRIQPGASVIIIATRWHADDLIGRLHSSDYEHETFEEINLPAVMDEHNLPADERVLGESGRPIKGVFREDVKALWPGYWPIEELAKKRTGAGEYDWWALYQGVPQPKGSTIFSPTPSRYNLLDFKRNLLSKGGYRLIISVDPAATASSRADYSVASVMAAKGYGDDMQTYLLYVMRGQWTIPDLCRNLKSLQAEWGVPMAIEAVGAFKAIPDLLRESDPSLIFFPVVLKGDKFARSQPYATAWNEGRVHIPLEEEWAKDWIAEHAGFTGVNDRNDDQVDAGAHAFTALLRTQPVRKIPTPPVGPFG